MEVLSAMNNHIQAKSVCPAWESNPRPSAFRGDALTTELQGWDDSTRRNFFTQLCLAFRAVLTLHGLCAMGTTPAAAMAVLGVISVQHFCPFEGSQTRSKQTLGLGAMGTTPAAAIAVRLAGFGI